MASSLYSKDILDAIRQPNSKYGKQVCSKLQKVANFIFGVLAVILALPFITFLLLLSLLLTQEQCDRFWDEFK